MQNSKYYIELDINDNKLVIRNCINKDFCDQLIKTYVIINNSINVLEASYLIAIEKASINSKAGWEEALELIKRYEIPLQLFLVYYDLRKRGRRVWEGARSNTLISETTNLKRIEVLVLKEGDLINAYDIANWSELAVSDSHIPIIAIVDKNGDITYYESRIFAFATTESSSI